MRGKGGGASHIVAVLGITPAHAGKKLLQSSGGIREWDHPRMCGEKSMYDYGNNTAQGSPPYVRGKARANSAIGNDAGITPAHAGKSNPRRGWSLWSQDHPRACGEKFPSKLLSVVILGSPPRMRGKARLHTDPHNKGRITPAHAGKRLKRSRSTVPHAAIVPLFPSVCNKPAGSDGSPAGHDAPPFLPIENAAPASPAYNLRSL